MASKFSATIFLCALAVLRAEDFKQTQATSTERIEFAPGGVIRLDHSIGDLYIEGWDQPAVEITVVKSTPYNFEPKHPERAGQHLERIQVHTERRSNTELAITTMLPSHAGVEYVIHVPRESRLEIKHRTGYVFVNDVRGDIQATGARGDILLMLPAAGAYSIDAQTKFGTISSDFEGPLQVARYRLGERYAMGNGSNHHIRLRMGFGGITIKALQPESSTTTLK